MEFILKILLKITILVFEFLSVAVDKNRHCIVYALKMVTFKGPKIFKNKIFILFEKCSITDHIL